MILRAVLGLAMALALVVPAADAGGAGRLKFGRISGGGDLGSQTVYFGPWTHVGAGGADVCALPCVAPWTITSGAPLNYVKDSDGMLTTKDGNAGTAYDLPRTTGQLVSETFTITDSIGQTKTINAVVDASRAGTRTVANRPSVDNNSTSLPQWLVALQYSSYGDTIAWRSGSRFNTPDQSGYFNGSAAYNVRNTGPIAGTFTGENHVVIRPEVGGTAVMGHFRLDGQNNMFPGQKRLDGIRFQGMEFYGVLNDVPLIQSVNLVSFIDIFDSSFYGDEGNWLWEVVSRPRGITKDESSGRWRIRRSLFQFLNMGAALPNSSGPANGGAASYSDPTNVANEVTDSVFRSIYTDALAMPCATGAVITGNLFTDKVTGVTMGSPYHNPFNSLVQPHGDAIQFSNTSCGWGRLAGPTVVGNIITRGFGRNSLPFWTEANGYPNPNTPGPSCCLTPDPNKGYTDYQGIFNNNSGAGEANHLDYNVVWVNPVITHNFIQVTMGNGISFGPSENPIVEFNIAIADEPGPANLTTSPFGSVSVALGPVTGADGRFRYNVGTAGVTSTLGSGGALDVGVGTGVGGSTNQVASRASYNTLFAAPAATRRTYLEARDAFKPKVGGGLFVNPNQPAGVWCADGSLRSAGSCP